VHHADDTQNPLPYVSYVAVRAEDRGKVGTTIDTPRASRGYNLYAVKPDSTALLVDMQGEVVHRWSSPVEQPPADLELPQDWNGWEFVRMLPDGDLLAVVFRKALIRLDWDSHVKWTLPIGVHHDAIVVPDGKIWTLGIEPRVVDLAGRQRTILDEFFVVVSADGKVEKRMSLFDLAASDPATKEMMERLAKRRYRALDRDGLDALLERGRDPFSAHELADPAARARAKELLQAGKVAGLDAYRTMALLRAIPTAPSDLLHSNSIVRLKAHPAGLWKDGDALVSIRNLDLLMVFDPDQAKVVWTWRPDGVFGQHQATMLDDGHILLFDNGRSVSRRGRRYSRVVELDPVSKTEVWSYQADPPRSFFAPAESGCQLLPNGDILVAAETGRAFELTRSNQLVWEYFNPKFDQTRLKRSGFYRMERLPPEVVEPLLARGPPAAASSASAAPAP
jgi:hypothetical protein